MDSEPILGRPLARRFVGVRRRARITWSVSTMSRSPFLRVVLATLLLTACAPLRPPVPPGEIPAPTPVAAKDEQYGQAVLAELVERYPLSKDDQAIERVREITDRLTAAANAGGEPWHVYVLEGDDLKNAAATRGNYIFVWTGMLTSIRNDAELATVIAHEIGHVLAGHTAPDPHAEVSRMIAGVAGAVTGHTVSSRGGGPLANIASSLVEAAIEAVLINPTSQSRELEADHIGLFLMADAGFDPSSGIEFWRRAQFDPELRGAPLEFLSSHPSTEDRFIQLEAFLGRAQERYDASKNVPKQGDSAPIPSPSRTAAQVDIPDSAPTSEPLDWVIAASIAPVFASPDRGSEVVAELAAGAAIRGTPRGERWVEITGPTKGFIEKVDLDVVLPDDWIDSGT